MELPHNLTSRRARHTVFINIDSWIMFTAILLLGSGVTQAKDVVHARLLAQLIIASHNLMYMMWAGVCSSVRHMCKN